MKADQTVEGLLLKTLNNKAIWRGVLHMAGWIEGRIPVMHFEKKRGFLYQRKKKWLIDPF